MKSKIAKNFLKIVKKKKDCSFNLYTVAGDNTKKNSLKILNKKIKTCRYI